MKCFSSITLVATLASSVVASPLQGFANTTGIANTTTIPVDTDALLLHRRDEYGLCKPDGRAYTKAEFDNAYNEGKNREVNGPKLRAKGGDRREYPRYFGNQINSPQGHGMMISLEGTSCQDSWELREWPIKQGGHPEGEWRGGLAGPDRVVFGRKRKTNDPWISCFIMTHEGVDDSNFRRCK